jgi:hypothetical protein
VARVLFELAALDFLDDVDEPLIGARRSSATSDLEAETAMASQALSSSGRSRIFRVMSVAT